MPSQTYITAKEKKLPGHKPMKDRLILALCGNASGDFKVKLLLVYHSENSRAFKAHNVDKDQLPVVWRSNSKAWVTRQFFVQWVNQVFSPSVKKYLHEQKLPLKCLLCLDNAPSHPPGPGLKDHIFDEFKFIKPYHRRDGTTSANLGSRTITETIICDKAHAIFTDLKEESSGGDAGGGVLNRTFLRRFQGISWLIIDQAWGGLTRQTLNSAWKKLWPDAVFSLRFHRLDPEPDPVVGAAENIQEIVSLGKSMGLEWFCGEGRKKFRIYQRSYTPVEKVFALVLALKHFKGYDQGNPSHITGFMDHNPFKFLQRMRNQMHL
ncbi:tigger transposable element-derived protein 1-like [Palaemon carinicauda]|uniref:tigger transposable element-derived protein 1-like n=1 Tax=Palaemon carinicauda TaxID=392227 RepID=UPI0035B66024